MSESLPADARDQLVRTCRTAIGDELRSVTYFTQDHYQHLYLREDLERGEDPLAFVDTERKGFATKRTYEWSELGNYKYNIRVFERGYIVRVINDGRGAYVTTDALSMQKFEELAEAVAGVLPQLDTAE